MKPRVEVAMENAVKFLVFTTNFTPLLTRCFAAANAQFHGFFHSADVCPWHLLVLAGGGGQAGAGVCPRDRPGRVWGCTLHAPAMLPGAVCPRDGAPKLGAGNPFCMWEWQSFVGQGAKWWMIRLKTACAPGAVLPEMSQNIAQCRKVFRTLL